MHKKITDDPDLVKDQASQAVINTNYNAYKEAKSQRKKRLQNEERITLLEEKLNRILELLEDDNN